MDNQSSRHSLISKGMRLTFVFLSNVKSAELKKVARFFYVVKKMRKIGLATVSKRFANSRLAAGGILAS